MAGHGRGGRAWASAGGALVSGGAVRVWQLFGVGRPVPGTRGIVVDDADRLEVLRARVVEQHAVLRAMCLRSKELRAHASAVGDRAVAMLLLARGHARSAEPPVPTHPPDRT